MKIREILDDIKSLDLVLPEFQREYVWEREQAKQLMVSLFKDYPTGSLLFWKTDKPPEIKNTEIPSDRIGSTKVILDGQQRLTTLFLFIENNFPPYYKEKEIKVDPRNLFVNLELGNFQYYQLTLMKNDPSWIPVVDCFNENGCTDVFQIAKKKVEGEDKRLALAEMLNKNLNKLRNIREKEYPVQIVPMGANIDDAIDVFDRVNSLGTKLSEAELALAHICGKWSEARRVMKEKIDELSQLNFYFDLKFIVRCLTGIVNGRGIFETIHKTPKEDLLKAWKILDKTLDYLVNVLPTHAFINSTEDINSTNVLVPVVVFLAHRECKFKKQEEMKKIFHWIYAAHTWSRYTSQTDQRLDHDIAIVIRNKEPWHELINALIDQRGRIEVKPSDLEGRWIQDPLYRMTYILVKSNGAIDWFNGSPLDKPVGKSYKVHSHHIFPVSVLYKSGKYNSENHIHKKIVNEIANRAFLTADTNISISNKKPSEYLKEIQDSYPGALEKQFIPTNPKFWEIERYEEFLEQRRELISKAINGYLYSLIEDVSPQVVESIEAYIDGGENAMVEFKSTLRWDLQKKQVNKELEKTVVKTMCGFMNTEGGVLLIGVEDDGSIIGIEDDLKTMRRQDIDGFQQLLTQIASKYYGAEFTPYLDITFHNVNGKKVCKIEVESTPKPVYLSEKDEKEFYIRAGSTTRLLDVQAAHDYIGMHWER